MIKQLLSFLISQVSTDADFELLPSLDCTYGVGFQLCLLAAICMCNYRLSLHNCDIQWTVLIAGPRMENAYD